jgi:hypothetical protein
MHRNAKLTAALALVFGVVAAASPSGGTYALQSGSARVQAYMSAAPIGGEPLRQHLEIWMTRSGSAEPIRRYTVDMTKLLHLIIVSDDLVTYLHVHPTLGSDGRFRIDQRLPAPALYHVYADAEPEGDGQQVFRFELTTPGGAPVPKRLLPPDVRVSSAGPYTATLKGTTVPTGKPATLVVTIRRNGRPAADLHPYLGVPAHAVFIAAKDLTYLHTHPTNPGSGSMSGMEGMHGDMTTLRDDAKVAPTLQLPVTLRERGDYKMWLQFRGGDQVYTVPFVVTAR